MLSRYGENDPFGNVYGVITETLVIFTDHKQIKGIFPVGFVVCNVF